MYISDCMAFQNIEIEVTAIDSNLNLYIRSPRNGSSVSVTLSPPQVATIATALLESLTAVDDVQDMGVFGSAVIGRKVERKLKGAA